MVHCDTNLRDVTGARPGFTSRPPLRSFYLTFKDELPKGFRLATAFQKSELGEDQFQVELVIEMPERTANAAAFDQLREAREAVGEQIGERLEWKRVSEHNELAARVFAYRPGSINSSAAELDEFKKWAVGLLPKFRDAFAPSIALAATTEEAVP